VKSQWVRITKPKVLQEHTEIERFLVAADPRCFLESSEVKLTGELDFPGCCRLY
jgi:hypothetical protein